jgi:hypothetical protein
MLHKLALTLQDEEEGIDVSRMSIVLDGGQRCYGIEGVRSAIIAIRAGRVHNVDVHHQNGTCEQFNINYWGNRL